MLFGTSSKLSPFYLNCAVRPKDPKPLAALGDPGLALSMDPSQFFDLGRLSLFLPWIFGHTILFLCGEFIPFMITCHEVGPLCYFLGPRCHDFFDLNNR